MEENERPNYGTPRSRRCNARVLGDPEKLAAVGRLASSIAHEINNPLEAVINLTLLVLPALYLWIERRKRTGLDLELSTRRTP